MTEPLPTATRFAVLGPLEVVAGDGTELSVGRPQRRALLALLLLHANQPLSAADIVRHLWGDQPPSTARAQVHALVSAVRQALPGGEQVLRTSAGGYELRLQGRQLDVHRFDADVAAAETAADAADLATAASHYRAALRQWRGRPLADVTAAFAERARRRLENRRLVTVESMVDVELTLGRHDDVITELTELSDRYPRRERPHRQLMLALSGGGRTAEAMDVYRAFRARMAAADPPCSTEMDTLAQRILRGADSGSTGDRPPAVPHQLPPAPSGTARPELLDDAVGATDPGVPPIVVATGQGAATTVLRWAQANADRYPGGQLYADLHTTTPAAALAGFLRALGVPSAQIPSAGTERAALFRSAVHGSGLLLVLDNATGSDQVYPLLPGCASCTVLVTSTDALGGLVARYGAHRVTPDGEPE